MDNNTQSPQDEDQSVQSTDQNEEVLEQDTQLEDQSQATEQAAQHTQEENQNEDDRILSRGERRREQYAEKMANRIRTQAEQDSAAGRSLFSNDINYKPISYEAGEFDVDQLEQDRRQAAQQSFNQGVQQGASLYELERFGDRLETDIERIMSKHEMTDRRENLLIQSYLREVGASEDNNGRLTIQRPNVRFKDFAENYLKELDDIISEEVTQSTKNLQTQAANTGVRPNGQSANSLTSLSDQNLVEKLRAADLDTDEGKKLMEENRRRQRAALGF